MKPEHVQNLVQNSNAINSTQLGTHTSTLGVEENVGISDEKRVLNVLNIGPIGYGKTQLMAHAILQDLYKGHGVCVINPKGGLIDQLIGKMPEERHDDIIYINPGRDSVTPFNVLDTPYTDDMSTAQLENLKEIVVSDLIAVFKRYSENWGDRFGRNIATLLRAHIELNLYQNESNTLVDVFEAASKKKKLGEVVDRITDDQLHRELQTIKDELTDREMEPAVRRLKDFVENKTVRRVIDAQESGVDFREAVEDGKIVLVDIQKGEIGAEPSQIIGTLAITSVWAAVQSRITIPAEDRDPFYLYIDELQNFAQEGSNLKHVLAECREYGLGLWITSQYLNQLSPNMRQAVANNCRTKVFFNPSGSEDLSKINAMLRGIDRIQLTGFGKYRAVIQQPGEGVYSNAQIFNTYPPYHPYLTEAEIEEVKDSATNPGETRELTFERDTGVGGAAGGEAHAELLMEAKQYLEFEEDVQVNILQQDGSSKPDALIIGEEKVDYLEAEHSGLTNPENVLTNLDRAQNEEKRCVFIVKETNLDRLETILEDVDDDQYRVLISTDLGVIEP